MSIEIRFNSNRIECVRFILCQATFTLTPLYSLPTTLIVANFTFHFSKKRFLFFLFDFAERTLSTMTL